MQPKNFWLKWKCENEFLLTKITTKVVMMNLAFSIIKDRRSHQRCSVKKGLLRNFTKFTRKSLCQSLFYNKFDFLSKIVGHSGWLTTGKKKHWLKRPKAVPQKMKFRPKYKSFKISSLELFFWKYYFGFTTFYNCPRVTMDIIRVFFNFRFF